MYPLIKPSRFFAAIVAAVVIMVSAGGATANDVIAERMAEAVPSLTPDSITPSPMPGMFEVRYGTEIFYVSEDGGLLFQGNLIDLETRANLTEKARQDVRQELFAAIPDSELTVYAPTGTVRHTLNVFTDPNCTFCRQFHNDIQRYVNAGVKVRYFMFPVLGRESPTIMRNIWCSDDRNTAMDRAKAGRSIPDRECTTPLDEHMALGRQLGINGTPATVTNTGLLISGFRAAPEMLLMLE